MSTLKIFIFLVSCIESNFVEGHTAKYTPIYHNKNQQVINESKRFWPSCLPFWPFRHCGASPQVPLPSLLPPLLTPPIVQIPKILPPLPSLLPPLLAPPIVQIPKILPPSLQPVPLIPIPTVLVFVDLRIEVVYPVVQKFKNIITIDPLGITKTWVGSDLCSYKGFFCDIPPDNASATVIASVDFNGYGLAAPTLDGFIDQLPDLALFHANSNNFGGTVSPNIAKLKYLYELDLSNNKFTGPFPQAVVGMEGLGFLDIRFNLFSGSVPPAIFTQSSLEVLFLNDNNFVSTLPETIGNTHILYLTLANNRFIGPIPRDIAKALSGLAQVLLLNNRLTGCLPYKLGFLNQVTVFDISNNLLTGPLPFSLACLDRVELLDFSSNLLYGMVPDLLCHLPNLANLSLSDNYFTQVGPHCRMLISQGVLDVRNNCIPDLPFQRSMIECMTFLATPRLCAYPQTYGIIPCKPHFYP